MPLIYAHVAKFEAFRYHSCLTFSFYSPATHAVVRKVQRVAFIRRKVPKHMQLITYVVKMTASAIAKARACRMLPIAGNPFDCDLLDAPASQSKRPSHFIVKLSLTDKRIGSPIRF